MLGDKLRFTYRQYVWQETRQADDQDQARSALRGDPAAAGDRSACAVRRARFCGGGHGGDRPGRRGDSRRPVPPVSRQGRPVRRRGGRGRGGDRRADRGRGRSRGGGRPGGSAALWCPAVPRRLRGARGRADHPPRRPGRARLAGVAGPGRTGTVSAWCNSGCSRRSRPEPSGRSPLPRSPTFSSGALNESALYVARAEDPAAARERRRDLNRIFPVHCHRLIGSLAGAAGRVAGGTGVSRPDDEPSARTVRSVSRSWCA